MNTAADLTAAELEPRASRFSGLRSWLDDRINPILVKEVRQALRGRYFRNIFWLTVVAATAISVLSILSASSEDYFGPLGPAFFSINYGVLVAAINAFVPFWAFQSMSSEWEENTYDLLSISNLRPRQLLLGKALAAWVQSLLFFCAFVPFLVSTFLMGGVDLLSIAVILTATLLLSAALSIVALAVATFGRSRVVRAILAIAVIALLLLLAIGTASAMIAYVQMPEMMFGANELTFFLWMVFCVVPLVATLAFAVGCARLAHEHENRSTFLRVVITLVSVITLGWGLYQAVLSSSPDREWLEGMPALATIIGIVPFLFFSTEPESLGRRVVKQVPKSKLMALLALPFLPGGGRGMWLYIATSVATLAVVFVAMFFGPGGSGTSPRSEPVLFVAVMFAYGFVTIGLFSGLGSLWASSLGRRTAIRFAGPLLVIMAVILPALLGFMLDLKSWMEFEHPFNPFWVLIRIVESRAWGTEVNSGLVLLGLAVVLTLAVNLGRLSRSIGETLRASKARRERELAESVVS